MKRLPLAPPTILAALVLALASFQCAQEVIIQPIAFDHARHQKEDLACLDCHKMAETSPYASFPKIATCALCHAEAKGDSAEEKKVRDFIEKKAEIPWVQVNRMPGHVYFSHAMHVKIGKMDCAECHGKMAEATEPVTESQVAKLTMRRCMACHAEKEASNDCLACHK